MTNPLGVPPDPWQLPGPPQSFPSPAPPQIVFSGAYLTGVWSWIPAQAILSGGVVTLWFWEPTGWRQVFSVPAIEVRIRSVGQRLTLAVRGMKYPLFADAQVVKASLVSSGLSSVGSMMGNHGLQAWGAAATIGVHAGAAQTFEAKGGEAFVAAMRQHGAQVSRMGTGAMIAMSFGIGIGAILLAVIVVCLIIFS